MLEDEDEAEAPLAKPDPLEEGVVTPPPAPPEPLAEAVAWAGAVGEQEQ